MIRYNQRNGEDLGVQHCCEYQQARAGAVDNIGSSAQQQPKYSERQPQRQQQCGCLVEGELEPKNSKDLKISAGAVAAQVLTQFT